MKAFLPLPWCTIHTVGPKMSSNGQHNQTPLGAITVVMEQV